MSCGRFSRPARGDIFIELVSYILGVIRRDRPDFTREGIIGFNAPQPIQISYLICLGEKENRGLYIPT